MKVPETMHAVRLLRIDEDRPELAIQRVEVPRPGPGQVLVRVTGAPLHPGDRLFCRGHHGFVRPVPTTPGLEGTGVVVGSHSGLLGRALVGRRVSFLSDPDGDGSWAPWVAVQASRCVPVWPALSDTAAALLLLGPCTALGLLDEADAAGHRSVVVTAASGAIGRLLLGLCLRQGRSAVAVVSGAERVKTLTDLGFPHVVDLDAPDGDARLRREVQAVRATCALDAVGGATAGRVLAALPPGGLLIQHGTLSGAPPELDRDDLVFRRKRVRGYWFEDRLREDGLRAWVTWLPRLRWMLDEVAIRVRGHLSLEDVPAVVQEETSGAGRWILRPGFDP